MASEKLGHAQDQPELPATPGGCQVSHAHAQSEIPALNSQLSLEEKVSQLEQHLHQRTAELARLNDSLVAEMRQRQTAQQTAEYAALHDGLTDLPNRAFIRNRINRAIDRRKRDSGFHFAILFLDFDRFKVVNDSLGHDAGDELLVAIAQRIRQHVGSADSVLANQLPTAARLGGDEFILLIEDIAGAKDAMNWAERLITTLGAPYHIRGLDLICTVSIGITTSHMHYDRAEDVLRDADIAMYHAKAAGKARCMLFDRRMHEEIRDRLQLEADLRKAVDRNELQLMFQPVVSLETHQLYGFEALLRWNHPVRGEVSPGDFISCCEETGLIVPIGNWALRQACAQLAKWRKKFPKLPGLTVNVNLSANQLLTPEIVSTVKQTLDSCGLPPGALILEVTETVMITNAEVSIPVLEQLKALGVQLYMDDFGTGYSSMSCLHRFPLNGLKIDRSFVDIMAERRDYAAIVHSIIALASNLGIKIVAEGIETFDQAVMLQAMECTDAQGFYFSRPLTMHAAEALLRAGGFVGPSPAPHEPSAAIRSASERNSVRDATAGKRKSPRAAFNAKRN
jgi:diguanylate cyclase (GGDEF)-like protein